jgi:tetratricopeptide (TPR) repeat protein
LTDLGILATRQGRFREAEDLIQQSLSLTPPTDRNGIAHGLGFLGQVQLLTGRFAEVESTISECTAIWEELGWRVYAVKHSVVLAQAVLHTGAYAAARVEADRVVSMAREMGWNRGVGYGKSVLGEVALAEGSFEQAYSILHESNLCLKQFTADPWDTNQSARLGLAARRLERRAEAWQHLADAVAWAEKGEGFNELMTTVAGIALLLADDGKAERAVELYALASRYPFVAKSRWFEDVVGEQIVGVAAALPPQVAKAAPERGRGLDLEETVAQLSVELGRYLSTPHCHGSQVNS